MSTIEDFRDAPVGATATQKATGNRAMKVDDSEWGWIIATDDYVTDEGMANLGYTLDPSPSGPTTAREALELAWELAHEVKPGQVIPEGARFLQDSNCGLVEHTAELDITITPALAPDVRTFDPLPEPEPDWLDAPAVLARHVKHAPDSRPSLWVNLGDGMWGHAETTKRATVWDLRDVTPLYPKEDA